MNRLERRLRYSVPHEGEFATDQALREQADRERTARKVRTHLRRMEPAVLLTPRWSRPQGFLEGVAMDLAVGEPTLGCRTASFRPMKGRSATESWRYTLGLIARLVPREAIGPQFTGSASREGFRSAVASLLVRVQDSVSAPVALLLHGAEYLPLDALEDLSMGWQRFAEANPAAAGRRVTLLLSGCMDVPALALPGAPRLALIDYAEAEAAAALVGRAGPASRPLLEAAARFTGGVPAMVEALGSGARELGAIPRSQSGLIRCLGPVADEIRGAVDIVAADSRVAERLEALSGGEPAPVEEGLDERLLTAGLVRRVRAPGDPQVVLRAPAIGSLLG